MMTVARFTASPAEKWSRFHEGEAQDRERPQAASTLPV